MGYFTERKFEPKVAIIGGGRNAGKTMIALIKAQEELEQYQAIGTAEEFKELKEKQIPKKVNLYIGNDMSCPACGHRLRNYEGVRNPFCKYCGQRLER